MLTLDQQHQDRPILDQQGDRSLLQEMTIK